MGATKLLLVTLALVLANALALLLSQSATAAADLSGTWSADYRLVCSATFDQSGQSLMAEFDCGSNLAGTLAGLVADDGTFSLSGHIGLGLITIEATGSAVNGGDGIAGTFSALPLVAAATFGGTRTSAGGDGLSGEWEIRVTGVFGGSCTIEVEHAGSALTATIDCNGRPLGVFTGAFDAATGSATLDGQFTEFTTLHMEGTVAPDARSLSGTWRLNPSELSGVIEAQRLSGPNAEPTEPGTRTATPAEPEPTATPAASALPPTGNGGPATSGLSLWLMLVLAGVAASAGATFVVARRR